MEPHNVRMVGAVSILVGVAGLAFALLFVVLVATGATEAPTTLFGVIVPIQGVSNVAMGWNLRRRAEKLTD